MRPAQYDAAEALEEHLGDPEDPAQPFSYRHAVELDELDEAPAVACRLLDEWGVNLYYIPAAAGGRLDSFEEALAIGRMVSRRDLSAAIEHGISFLGYTFVWLAGSPDLKSRAAGVIRDAGRVALGLTEKEHGGDLAGCECRAELHDGQYRLSGEKWLINNATRGKAISLFARTDPKGGPRGFSFLFVDKSVLPAGSFVTLPRVRTHGIRGVDISGIRFDGSPVPAGAVIGIPGTGLEIALKGLQVTRTMCTNLSLGAADTALRIGTDFAIGRRIYASTVHEIPAARAILTDAFLDLLVSDCVSIGAARALHVMPEQMSVHSAIAKYFVPVACERAVQSLSIVLGARHYLREGHWNGMFQKILRDIGIVSLFDGSTAVNLNVISAQLPALCENEPSRLISERIASLFDLAAPVPHFEPDRLSLFNKGEHDVVQVIPELDAWIARVHREPGVTVQLVEDIRMHVQELNTQYQTFRSTLLRAKNTARQSRGQTSEMFEMARRYCVLHAAAASVLLWLKSRHLLGDFFARGEWLESALARLISMLKPNWNITPARNSNAIWTELLERFHSRILFSVVPLRLAARVHGTHQT